MPASRVSALTDADTARAALGWLTFAVAFWLLGPYSNHSPTSGLDPWIPTGYFLNFEDLVNRYGFRYYVSRLPYILTGLTFYSVFTPHIANFVLHSFHLWLACFALYCAAAAPFGKSAAIIATVAFATSTYTATAMAWDYPNGAAISFLLLGLWLALSPPASMPYRVRWIAVGFLWAISGTDNLLAVIAILPSCLMVLYLARFSFREMAKRTLLILTGVGLMLIIFGIVSKWLFGNFMFLSPQINLVLQVVNDPVYLANMWGQGHGWISVAFRLAALLGIFVAAAVVVALRARHSNRIDVDVAVAVVGLLFLTLCAFAFVEFVLQGVVLRVPYTSAYIVASAYLALAAALGLLMENWPLSVRRIFVPASTIVLVAIPYAGAELKLLASYSPATTWLLQGAPAFLITSGALLALSFRRVVSAIGAAALIVLPALSTSADQRLHWVFHRNQATFDAAVKVLNILRSGPQDGRTIRFWFDPSEPHGKTFVSIGVLYLEEWQGLRDLQKWTDGAARAHLPEGTLLVHLTSDPDKLTAREAQLTDRGIGFGPRRSIPIRAADGMEFFLILQDIGVHAPRPSL